MSSIQLIVGLGNPGEEYAATRHNVGAWFVEQIAGAAHVQFRTENKLFGRLANIEIQGQRCWLLLPLTYMNVSGKSVRAVSQYYQIPPEAILVAHDELDFDVGTIRLKQGGGHGGHNGLRDIIQQLQTDSFNRLRIGIGHPGQRSAVHGYVLSRPSAEDKSSILQTITRAETILPELLAGQMQKAIQTLHS